MTFWSMSLWAPDTTLLIIIIVLFVVITPCIQIMCRYELNGKEYTLIYFLYIL